MRTPHAGAVLLDGRPLQAWSPTRTGAPHRAPAAGGGHAVGARGRADRDDGTVSPLRWLDRIQADRIVVEDAMRSADACCFAAGGSRHSAAESASACCWRRAWRRSRHSCCWTSPRRPSTSITSCSLFNAPGPGSGRARRHRRFYNVNLALTFCTRIIVLADHTIACDMPIDVAADRDDWLALFSSRLRRTAVDDGRAWVCYR